MWGAAELYLDRKGLGYGQLKQKFHKPNKAGSDFPYVSKDDKKSSDEDIDDESFSAVKKKVYDFPVIDYGDARSTDRLYFAGAATKLTSCFERPDEVLLEIMATGKSLPYASRYNNKKDSKAAVGGYSSSRAFDTRPAKQTGTKRGWSKKPPLGKIAVEDQDEENKLYTLKDLAINQRKSLGECFGF